MIFDSYKKNIETLLKTIGPLKREQLIQFFSSEDYKETIQNVLNQEALYAYLRYNEAEDTYSSHDSDTLREDIKVRYIFAFWPIAYFGSINVRQITPKGYPEQFEVETTRNVHYSFSVCYNESDARTVRDKFAMETVKGEPDETIKVAVVFDEKLGDKMGKYGFDFYCIVDRETHIPSYTRVSDRDLTRINMASDKADDEDTSEGEEL